MGGGELGGELGAGGSAGQAIFFLFIKNGEDSKSNRKVLVGKEAVVSMCYGRLLSSSNFLLLLQSSVDDWIHK